MTFKELLESKGMTGYKLAKITGVSIGSINRFLSGKSIPENMLMSTATKIADALEMSLDELREILEINR